MSVGIKDGFTPTPFAVIAPGGGAAKQFRVQFYSDDEPGWRMYATFSQPEGAEECLDKLQQQGYQARIVKFQLPAVG